MTSLVILDLYNYKIGQNTAENKYSMHRTGFEPASVRYLTMLNRAAVGINPYLK